MRVNDNAVFCCVLFEDLGVEWSDAAAVTGHFDFLKTFCFLFGVSGCSVGRGEGVRRLGLTLVCIGRPKCCFLVVFELSHPAESNIKVFDYIPNRLASHHVDSRKDKLTFKLRSHQ